MPMATSRRSNKDATNALLMKYHSSVAYQLSKMNMDRLQKARDRRPTSFTDSNDSSTASVANGTKVSTNSGGQSNATKSQNSALATTKRASSFSGNQFVSSVREPTRNKTVSSVNTGKQNAEAAFSKPSLVPKSDLSGISEQRQDSRFEDEVDEIGGKNELVARWLDKLDCSAVACESPTIPSSDEEAEEPLQTDTAIHIVYDG